MPPSQSREPYDGSSRKLVLALDVGTTFSGISYAILDPGEVPKILTVTSYPGQTSTGGDSKIPSVMYYDDEGVVQAVGQEAENLAESGEAEEMEWIRVQWFKLCLRPKMLNAPRIADDLLSRLPVFKTIIDVFADFLSYLFTCAKDYIRTAHAAGDALLRSLEGNIDFVMGHPNGWGGLQQQRMRKAAVEAGLVPDMKAAEDRIQFVTEGEASLYYCLENGLSSDAIKPDNKIMIVDAGGGTIDLSSYRITKAKPIKVEEVAIPGCRVHGSVFVNERATAFLFEKLKGSIYDDPQDIDNIVRSFEKTVKRRFKASNETVHIRFGSRNDNDPEYGISKGIMKLTGNEVSQFFNPSVDAIVDAVQEQRRQEGDIKTIFFVGGFAANDYLFSKLRGELAGTGIEISRPNGYTNKAVADGALVFYMDHVVCTRVARTMYGTKTSVAYDPNQWEHKMRSHSIFSWPSGRKALPHAYTLMVIKGSKINTEEEYVSDLFREAIDPDTIIYGLESEAVVAYSGASTYPQWTDVEPESYHTLCTIRADVSQAVQCLKPMLGPRRQIYYRFDFKIVLKFGLTELKAYTAWTENGVEKRSPASIVYLEE